MNKGLSTGILYLENERNYSHRKIKSYYWLLYIYYIPPLFIISLIFLIRYPDYPVWTDNQIYNLILLILMMLVFIAVFIPRRRFAYISKIMIDANMMTPPYKPFKSWVLRKPYSEEVLRINAFQIGTSPNISDGIEVCLTNGKNWYFLLKGNQIDGFLEVRPEDNKMLSSNIDLDKRKAIQDRFNLKGHFVN